LPPFVLSLEDELLKGLGPCRQAALQQRGQTGGSGASEAYEVLFRWAQRRVERRHYRQRVYLLA
jgi:preprotein translocase subunit SecA